MSKCILIADDNAVIRRTLRHILEETNGWQVCGEAVNGRDAVEKAEQLHPDLVVLDLSMPEMDGFQAARVLRRSMPNVPLILFTVFGNNKHIEEEAEAAGITAVVSKMDGVTGLVSKIQSALAPV